MALPRSSGETPDMSPRRDTIQDARDAMRSLKAIRRRLDYHYYRNNEGRYVIKPVEDIQFGPIGYAALVGDNPEVEAA